MKYRRTSRFHKSYNGLSSEIKEKAKKAFKLFSQNPNHRSLVVKPIQGTNGLWEARVDIHYRVVFYYDRDESTNEKICVFTDIGTHDVEKRK